MIRTKLLPQCTLSLDFFESVFVELSCGLHTLLLAVIYRRPGAITESFISQLQETLQSIDLGQYKEVIVTGDFNFDALKLEGKYTEWPNPQIRGENRQSGLTD